MMLKMLLEMLLEMMLEMTLEMMLKMTLKLMLEMMLKIARQTLPRLGPAARRAFRISLRPRLQSGASTYRTDTPLTAAHRTS